MGFKGVYIAWTCFPDEKTVPKCIIKGENVANFKEIKLGYKFSEVTGNQEKCWDNYCAIFMSLLQIFISFIDGQWYHYKMTILLLDYGQIGFKHMS